MMGFLVAVIRIVERQAVVGRRGEHLSEIFARRPDTP